MQNTAQIGSLSYMTPLGIGVTRTKYDWWGKLWAPDNLIPKPPPTKPPSKGALSIPRVLMG